MKDEHYPQNNAINEEQEETPTNQTAGVVELPSSVNGYLNLSAQGRYDAFIQTITNIGRTPDFWMDYDKIFENAECSADIHLLDYLSGKDDNERLAFFKEYPDLLRYIPRLLGIRKNQLADHSSTLKVVDSYLDFVNIDVSNIEQYLTFMDESGLGGAFKESRIKSTCDYLVGLEAGLNTHARKNRSGTDGENYLLKRLKGIAANHQDQDWEYHGQTTRESAMGWYGIDIGADFNNRRFDGSLFNPATKRCLFLEVNNFNSSGSKSKAVSAEFKELHDAFNKINHEFVYITDGLGWLADKTHLREAMDYIPTIFNYKMIEKGYLMEFSNRLLR